MSTIHGQASLPQLGDYEVLDMIAEGSMSSVYRGRHRETGTRVAIKVPHPAVMASDELRERFRQEYQAGRMLNHPNLVRMLDFGQTDAGYFLVMEYVDGSDFWGRIVEQGRLPEREAVDVILQVARGLQEAHRHGIIHRDVKPENILLTADGKAKLGDLGLIKDLEGTANLTCAQKGLGTPNFMAPEQFTEARQADARCDVYSLGTTLYMAVTGVLPFEGRSVAATLRKKLNNEITPARQIVPNLSERVDWVIRRAMQLDPERRYPTCLAFIQALTGEDSGDNSAVLTGAAGPRGKGARPANERRQAVRYPCALATVCDMPTSIHPTTETPVDQWPGKVLNLSVSGIGLLLRRRFEPGTMMTILLESLDRSVQAQREVEVVRSERTRGEQWFIGGRFTQPLEKDELRRFL